MCDFVYKCESLNHCAFMPQKLTNQIIEVEIEGNEQEFLDYLFKVNYDLYKHCYSTASINIIRFEGTLNEAMIFGKYHEKWLSSKNVSRETLEIDVEQLSKFAKLYSIVKGYSENTITDIVHTFFMLQKEKII